MSDSSSAVPPVAVSPADAHESLAAIEATMTRIRRSIASAGAPYLIVWGAIWVAGFAAVQVSRNWGGWVFTGLDVVGMLLSVLIVMSQARKSPVRSAADRKMFRRIRWFCILSFGYVFLWLAMAGRWDGLTPTAFICTAIMFEYVVLGLWLDALYLTWTGLAVTGATAAGFYLVPGWFMLWMAVFGGGTLLGTGLYIRRAWR